MTAVSPWAPPQGGTQQAPVPSPPPGPPQYVPPLPPRRRTFWLLVVGATIVIVAAVAATAAITYAITRNTNAPNGTPPPAEPTAQAPQFSTAEQAAAKQHVCQVFDVSTRGTMAQGGVRQNGQPNVLPLVRTVNTIVAVQNSLTPAVPADVAQVARRFIDANLQLTTAASGPTATDEVNRLNSAANDATFAFADACGLPH